MTENKVALVTGSTNGIGTTIAHVLASKGCNLIITGLGEPEIIGKIKSDLETKHGVKVDYVPADLTQEEDIKSMCEKIKVLYPNGLDILVNNAAVGMWDAFPVEHFPMENWSKIMAVNLTAPFMLIGAFLPGMKKKGWGRIVNMGSIEGLLGNRHMLSAYSASKHGLIGLTKSVALECATDGVTCNAVCPTGVSGTAMMDTWYEQMIKQRGEEYRQKTSKEDFEKRIAKINPTMRNNTPEQVADMVQFLCLSVASDQITGASYVLDGGFTAQ